MKPKTLKTQVTIEYPANCHLVLEQEEAQAQALPTEGTAEDILVSGQVIIIRIVEDAPDEAEHQEAA